MSKLLPFIRFVSKISAIEKAEIKRIGDYIKDLEEGLVEWDYDQIAMQTEMPFLFLCSAILRSRSLVTPV